MTTHLDIDYLVVGSGAAGMAFVDTLLQESDARVVMVDRHHAPGGHWNDAYSYVRLHQPSAFYGVGSRRLGADAVDASGLNAGMCERASGSELLAYYEAVMQGFLDSGRVQYLPMHDYAGDWQTSHTATSRVSGAQCTISAQKVVNTTHFQLSVPSTRAPQYEIADGVRCIPLNGLPHVTTPPTGYVVVGSGKTGIDACLWLLDAGTPPEMIHWVMPRDAWYMNRGTMQPGLAFFERTFTTLGEQMEAVAAAQSMPDLFQRLEACGSLLRLDAGITPQMYHGALMSKLELAALRQIKHIIRLGRVQRVEAHRIVLAGGTVPADPGYLYVDCSASAVACRTVKPVFEGNCITPQFVRTVQPTFSAALIAYVEAHSASEAEKNDICQVVPVPDAPHDWLFMLAANMRNQQRWAKDKALHAWVARSRLDGFTAVARSIAPEDTARLAVLQRFGRASAAAGANLPALMQAAMGAPHAQV